VIIIVEVLLLDHYCSVTIILIVMIIVMSIQICLGQSIILDRYSRPSTRVRTHARERVRPGYKNSICIPIYVVSCIMRVELCARARAETVRERNGYD